MEWSTSRRSASVSPRAARRWKLPMRMWLWLRRTRTEERVGEGSSPRVERLAGLDEREGLRGVDAERLEHLGGEDLAHAALQRQPPVAAARPAGGALSPWCRDRAGARRRGRAPGRRESRGRRRCRGCRRGTDGRGSAAPAARGSCRAAARSGRSGRSTPSSESPPSPIRAAQRSLRKRSRVSGKAAGRTASKRPSPRRAWTSSGRKSG